MGHTAPRQYLDVAVGDAQAVAELHRAHQLLDEPGGVRLWNAVQLQHRKLSRQMKFLGTAWVRISHKGACPTHGHRCAPGGMHEQRQLLAVPAQPRSKQRPLTLLAAARVNELQPGS